MADIDRVMWDIKRCICHVPDACRDCSRYGHDDDLRCMEALMSDALELLKESVPQGVVDQIRWERNIALSQLKEIGKGLGEKMDDIVVLLKEQEAKTGYWIKSAGDDKCSVCGATYSDLYPDYQHTHYCPNCGTKMIGQVVKRE